MDQQIKTKRELKWIFLFSVVYACLAFFVSNSYYQLIMTIVPIWAVLGLSWNLLSGYSGLISFGHAAFFGLGAYVVALTLQFWNLSPWLGIILATITGGIAGLLIGIPTFRLRGHYFALAMLAYPLALLYIFEWLGFQELALPMKRESPIAFMQFEDQRVYVFLALLLLMIALFITTLVERSRFGMSLLAIKQDEAAAEAAGIDTLMWKLKAITISGAMAGAAGGFYAVVLLVVTPLAVFGMLVSAQALIVAMFGGVGTIWGPVIGAFTLVPLSEILHAKYAAEVPGIQGVIYGIAIVVIIRVAPEGIIWKIRALIHIKQSENPSTSGLEVNISAAEKLLTIETNKDSKPTILITKNVSKSFGGLAAVQAVNIEVNRGEILGVIGPNGAGKTTLFNLLNGFIKVDGGEIIFEEDRINGRRPNRICRLGIGRTFQVAKPFPRLTVLDNVVIGAYVKSATDIQAREMALAAIEVVKLGEDANQLAGNLTNKQLRQLELARALASKPKVLLIDEILAGLDAGAMQELMDLMRQIAKLGITIVIIEHSMQAMVKLVDRFIVLDNGAVLAEGPPQEIVKNPQVIEAYLGKRWLDNQG